MNMQKTEVLSSYSALNPEFAQFVISWATFIKTRISLEESENHLRICSEHWKTIDYLRMNMKKTEVLSS